MDSLVPNNGEAFVMPQMPEERKAEDNKEKSKLNASYPVLQEVTEWFADCIKAADSLQNIVMEPRTINGVVYDRTTSIEAQVLAHQLLQQLLVDRSSEWVTFLQEIEAKKDAK